MKLARPQLDVGIVASDAKATIDFYRDIVGLDALPSAELAPGLTQHRLRVGRHLIKVNELAEPPARQRGGVERCVGIRLIALLLDDLDDVEARIERAGLRYDRVPDDPARAYRVGFVRDPEGNVVELLGLREPGGRELRTRMQIGLTVSDVERSREFYGKQLGLPEQEPLPIGGRIGTRYSFLWGETAIKFWALAETPPRQTGVWNRHAGLRLFTAMVDDMDACHRELVEKGIEIPVAPRELGGVAKIMFLSDPDGNWIELAQMLQ